VYKKSHPEGWNGHSVTFGILLLTISNLQFRWFLFLKKKYKNYWNFYPDTLIYNWHIINCLHISSGCLMQKRRKNRVTFFQILSF
jgi:hypothetical protein